MIQKCVSDFLNLFKELFAGVCTLIWPCHCICCGELISTKGLCHMCAALCDPREGHLCEICGAMLVRENDCHCERCKTIPPPFEWARGVFDYQGPLGVAIRKGKYGKSLEAMSVVAQWFAENLPPEILEDPPEIVVPVALHWKRVKKRGFSPPLILASKVAKTLGVKCSSRFLLRIRNTDAQAGLNERLRQVNLSGALVGVPKRVSGRDILLVDDVMTTSATFRAAAQALKTAGARRVRCLALCQVEKESERRACDRFAEDVA